MQKSFRPTPPPTGLAEQVVAMLRAGEAEARSRRHDFVASGHLVLGALGDARTSLSDVLVRNGLNLIELYAAVERHVTNYQANRISANGTPPTKLRVTSRTCILLEQARTDCEVTGQRLDVSFIAVSVLAKLDWALTLQAEGVTVNILTQTDRGSGPV